MRRRRPSARRASAAALFALFSVVLVPAASASASAPSHVRSATDTLTITSFDADMTLGRDDDHSTLTVVERIVADFPDADENHGITRSIPAEGDGIDLHTDITSVTDAAGNDVAHTIEDEETALLLTIGDKSRYLHGEQTFVITYSQRDVVRDFGNADSQELYRDINGTGWDLPFGSVAVDLTLEHELDDTLSGNLACYTGVEGDTSSDCTINLEGDVITSSTGHLRAHENLTIAVGFDDGTFATPAGAKPSPLQVVAASLPWALLGVVVALGGWTIWWRLARWRDARGRETIVPQYTPPEGICPLEAAELLRRRKRGFAAQLVAFAVAGVVTIDENPRAPRSRRYSLTVVDSDAAEKLEPMERSLLLALVDPLDDGRSVVLDTRSRNIGDKLALRRRDAERSLAREGLLEWAPSTSRNVVRIPLIVASIASTLLSPFSAVSIGLPLTVLTLLATIAGSVFVYRRLASPGPRLTARGALAREHLEGLKSYMQLAEIDRIRFLQSPETAARAEVNDERSVVRLHEKLLPYAIVWGIEKNWISELESEYATSEAPRWFTGSSLTRVSAISVAFTTGTFAASSAPAAASGTGVSASSFGGSTGGGFSGGGGGGGGGGGW